MADLPEKLATLLEDFEFIDDRNERAALLIEYADKFREVPERVATRPFPEENHVERCESDAYVWAEDQADGTQKYYFAVENPQGISAKAMSAILDETLSGEPPEVVAKVPCDIVFTLFGKDISMGKGQGLMGIVSMVTDAARARARRN
jgi:sulfur transfer protein SufE